MRMKIAHITFLASLLCLTTGITSCVQEIDDIHTVLPQDGVTLTAICDKMLPQTTLTRADELTPKDTEEKKIKTLHLFFFDSQGQFLQPNNNNTTGAYYRIEVEEGQQASLTIPEDAFVGQNALTNVQVYSVANIYGHQFRTQWTEGGDIVKGDKDDPDKEIIITRLSDLQNWLYRPTPREDISKLPEPGMPMVGLTTGVDLSQKNQTIQIKMQALMARVDITVRLDANQTNHDRSLPKLQMIEYGVRNMPYFVPFTPPAVNADGTPDETTEIPEYEGDESQNPNIARERTVKYEGRILHDQQATETFRYYTYENVQKPTKEPQYPTGVDPNDESVTQRWKRTIADKNASAVVLKGIYTTHQGLTYTADFNIYMGSNTYNNFEVRRNRCYKNNITICGLDYVRNSDEEKYTFDGRVNVITDNPIYISIVNERKLDAHWNIVPMDLYFLRREAGITDLESYVDVSLEDPVTGEAPDWIRMEMIDSKTMQEGKKEEGFIQGGNFAAGTGAREYFYTNLVTETLKDNTKIRVSGPDHGSRSRIYFYVDENASVRDRSATVYITYNNKENDKRERTLELDQRGLLRVQGIKNNKNIDCYIEYYEEYIDHRDPLDNHEQDNVYYKGLPWAREGAWLATNAVIGQSNLSGNWHPFSPCEVYNNGQEMTKHIFKNLQNRITPINVMKTYPDDIPPSALHYCRAKNRRNPDGTYEENWYMPGISELEQAIEIYFSTFEEFQQNYYWSSATAKDPNTTGILGIPTLQENENPEYARATMYCPPERIPSDQTNPWIQSGSKGPSHNYTGGGNEIKGGNHGEYYSGRAPKTTVFRVRAFRSINNVQQ